MDATESDRNHIDADVLLPPRKRLLAGLKRQSCSESTSQCSHENNKSPSLSPSPSSPAPLSEFDVRLNNLLKSYKNGSNMSPKEIAEAARSAAVAAARTAEAARAAAEEKAAIAAKAVAVAKTALDLVALISDESGSRDKHQRKNKLKKQVPVQILYNKHQPDEKCGTDEELARRLHQAMNSSPRITKHSPGSDSKNQKHKKLKLSPSNEKSGMVTGASAKEGNFRFKLPSSCNDVVEKGIVCEWSNEDSYTVRVDDKMSKSSKPDEIEVNSCEVESSHSKEKTYGSRPLEDMCSIGRKRGRIKQKKLPLSICSFKDKANPKEELKVTNSLFTKTRVDKSTIPVEIAPIWKCQDFQVSQCIKQDKVVQS